MTAMFQDPFFAEKLREQWNNFQSTQTCKNIVEEDEDDGDWEDEDSDEAATTSDEE